MSPTVRAMRAPLLGALGIALAVPLLAAQPSRLQVKLRAFPVQIVLDTMVCAHEKVAATPAQAFAALRAVYAELKIPRSVADSANGQLGTLKLVRTYTLGNERLSVYLNCGTGMTGANADSWRITMGIASFVRTADDGTTTVATGLVAQAEDMGGASKEPAMCGSSGLLEARIAPMVKERLDGGR
ncbi:MAG: hypothetical protein IT360_21515 [Gemmatimonadaceae bacterium]|nr:hypothetical protein [Gemmatimonadaceae bacterium]